MMNIITTLGDNITPIIAYGKIKEKKVYPEDAAPQDVDRTYQRSKVGVNFNYFLETPYVKPYIKKVLWAVDYEHSNYAPANTSRGRLSTSFIVRRPIYEPFGLFYEALLSKIIADYGQSPFYFEEYGRLKDSGNLDVYLRSPLIIAGSQLVYDLATGQLYNEIYYLGVKAMENYVVIKRDRRLQSWEFGFMIKEPAF